MQIGPVEAAAFAKNDERSQRVGGAWRGLDYWPCGMIRGFGVSGTQGMRRAWKSPLVGILHAALGEGLKSENLGND